MISCIIADDEHVACEGVKQLIEQVDFLTLLGSFKNVIDADSFLKENRVDLLFLDIHMPKLNGMDYLKLKNNNTLVILTTAFTDKAIEAFEYGAVDYLLKPIRFDRFYKAVRKVEKILNSEKISPLKQNLERAEKDFFFVKFERKVIKLYYEEVFFIEALKDYSQIFSRTEKLAVPFNLKTIENQLPRGLFMRISKSHLINLSHIKAIDSDEIKIDKYTLTLSPLYKKELLDFIASNNFIKKFKY